MPKAPTGGLLLGDKQDEKRNCLTRDVTKSSSHSLTQPAPIASLLSLEPKLLFLLIQCELLDVVGDALASSKRSGKSTGLWLASYAATYALRRTRHADPPNRLPLDENRPGAIKPGFGCRSAELLVAGAGVACSV